jgi:NitT/TauT family transport system permease protein
VGKDKIRAAQCLGANRFQLFALVALPATVPYILTGMRLAMANAFVTIVAAELVASNDGLGKMLWDARLFMQVEDIFVALISLGLLGFATDRTFRLLIRAFAGRFNPTM